MGLHWSEVAQDAVSRHRALQKPAELAGLLELVAPANPKLVIEVGSDGGGTLWAWAQLGADVVAVTLRDGPYASGSPLVAHGATVVDGDSHALATWLRLDGELAGRQADLLFIDGDHSYEGACQDVMAYSQFVRPGGLIALHDICRNPGKPDVGVWRAWEELRGLARSEAREIVAEPRTWGGIGVIQLGGGV